MTQDAGMPFEIRAQGEIYMICQGAGGGYGDVLERDPQAVMKNIREQLLTVDTARRIYFVVFDAETLAVDPAATEALRDGERRARIARGRPFDDFCATWVTPGPAPGLPYFGAWSDNQRPVLARPPGGPAVDMPPDAVTGIMISNPKDRRIAELEAEVAALKAAARG